MDRTKARAGLIFAVLLLAACSRKPAIVVGSKNFTEQVLLGEILALQIERNMPVQVDRRLDLGGTLLAHEALVKGSIDLYPEYSGTALTAVLKRPPDSDAERVRDTVRAEYQKRWKVAWLQPLGFVDTFAMMIRGEMARSTGISTISAAAGAHPWKLGAGYEFRERPDGLDGLVKAYGLRLAGEPVSMDLGLLYTALAGRRVDMIAANSTDGLASVLDVAILKDDRHFFPPYECSVAVREDALTRFPQLRGVLSQLSGKLNDDAMRKLNYQVDGKHRPAAEVAREFVESLMVSRR